MASAPCRAACLAYSTAPCDVAALRLNADHERGLSAFARRENGFGAIHALLLREARPSAGDLRPDETVDAAAIAEFDFRRRQSRSSLLSGVHGVWPMGNRPRSGLPSAAKLLIS